MQNAKITKSLTISSKNINSLVMHHRWLTIKTFDRGLL
jgi:hypothetical protein